MQPYQRQFLELAIEKQVLRFGEFTLKSGRVSPYFFNAGLFNDGHSLARLAQAYTACIEASGIEFDMLFGPAYKGIPLATAVAMALAASGRNVPVAFNRKETKNHGEGGLLIGAPLQGRVLIIDDVITAGTAIRESIAIIQEQGATVAGIVIALDRQECGQVGSQSASQEISQQGGFPVFCIAGLAELLELADDSPALAPMRGALHTYRNCYGA